MANPLKILKASAGSGKTFNLALQYLILLFSGEKKYREILAVTFTNKATEEMKVRILSVLQELAKKENIKEKNPYKERILQALPQENAASLQEKAVWIYRQILHDYNRFSVSTIDGFVQKIIRSFAFELGLDTGFTLEMNIDKVKDDLMERLNIAIAHKKVLLDTVLNLVEKQMDNGKNWNYTNELLSFTNEIFKESFSKFEAVINSFSSEAEIDQLIQKLTQTADEINVDFERSVNDYASHIQDRFAEFEIPDADLHGGSRSALLKIDTIGVAITKTQLALADGDAKWFKTGKEYTECKRIILPLLLDLLEIRTEKLPNFILAEALTVNLSFLRLMQEIALILQVYRNETGSILISDSQKLLQGITGDAHQNPSFIWEKVGSRFQHFLFDEFQDTSHHQWDMFRPLLDNALASSPENVNIHQHLMVGDVKQAIYRWRNGDWRILYQGAKNELKAYPIFEDFLKDNRRSSKNIIEFNNHIFSTLPVLIQENLNQLVPQDEKIKTWWQTMGYHEIISKVYENAAQEFPADAPQEKQGGTVKLTIVPKTQSTGITDENLENENAIKEELRIMVLEIRKLIYERAYRLSDIAVLVRSNRQAIQVVEVLLNEQLAVISGEALIIDNQECIKIIWNVLKALFGTEKNTKLYLGTALFLYAKQEQKILSEEDWLKINSLPMSKMGDMLPPTFCAQYTAWISLPTVVLVEKIIVAFGLDHIASNSPYLLAFRDLVEKFVAYGDKGALAFLDWWAEEGVQKSLPSMNNIDAIQVMTVHKSKGLDFRAVMIPFTNWALSPSGQTMLWANTQNTPFEELGIVPLRFNRGLQNSAIADIFYEENLLSYLDNLNLLYVACTRCVDYLHIFVGEKKDYKDFSRIGHALVASLIQHPFGQSNLEKSSTFVLDHFMPTISKSAQPKEETEHYKTHINNKLQVIFQKKLSNRKRNLWEHQAETRKGNIMHEILANVAKVEEILPYMQEIKKRWNIAAQEEKILRAEVEEILRNPALEALIEKGAEVISEQNIIAADGKSLRPDKLFIMGKKVVILDYKFTKNEEKSHIKQVHFYRDQLQLMGFNQIKTYLYYYYSNTLKSV